MIKKKVVQIYMHALILLILLGSTSCNLPKDTLTAKETSMPLVNTTSASNGSGTATLSPSSESHSTQPEPKVVQHLLPPDLPVISPENVGQLVEYAVLGKGIIKDIAWSPDSKNLVVATTFDTYLYESRTFELVKTLGIPARQIIFSEDGGKLAVAEEDKSNRDYSHEVSIWNTSTWTVEIKIEHSDIHHLAFSADGNKLAITSGRDLSFWFLGENPQEIKIYSEQSNYIKQMAFSPDGVYLASIDEYGGLTIWDTVNGDILFNGERSSQQGGYSQLVFSTDGSIVAVEHIDKITFYKVQAWEKVIEVNVTGDWPQILPDGKSYTNFTSADERGEDEGPKTDFFHMDETLPYLSIPEDHLVISPQGDYALSLPGYYSVVYSPQGNTIMDYKASLWELPSGKLLNQIEIDVDLEIVCFSPDGKLFLAQSPYNNSLHIYRIQDGRLINSIYGFTDHIGDLEFSPDGSLLASDAGKTDIFLWDINTGEVVYAFYGGSAVHFSPSGELIATNPGGLQGVTISEIRSKRIKYQLEVGEDDEVECFDFSPDGSMIAGRTYTDGSIRVWEAKDERILYTVQGNSCPIFSPDGKLLATGAFLYTAKQGELVRTIDKQESIMNFTQDGSRFVSGSEDGSLHIRKTADGTETVLIKTGLDHNPYCARFSPSGDQLYSSGTVWRMDNGTLQYTVDTSFECNYIFSPNGSWISNGREIYNSANGNIILNLETLTGKSWSTLAISPDGKVLALGGSDGTIQLLGVDPEAIAQVIPTATSLPLPTPAATAPALKPLPGNREVIGAKNIKRLRPFVKINFESQINGVEWSTKRNEFAILTIDDISIFNGDTLERVAILDPGGWAMAFSPTQPILAVSDSKQIEIRGTEENKKLQTYQFPKSTDISCLDFSPDGTRLAVGTKTGEITLWDVETGQKVQELNYPETEFSEIFQVLFTPDGKRLLSAFFHSLHIWDLATGELVTEPLRFDSPVSNLSVSADSKHLALVSTDIFILNIQNAGGEILKPFLDINQEQFLEDWITQVAIGNNKDILLAGDESGGMGAITVNPVKPVFYSRQHTSVVSFLALSPDGRTLITASLDGSVVIWVVTQ